MMVWQHHAVIQRLLVFNLKVLSNYSLSSKTILNSKFIDFMKSSISKIAEM